MTDDLVGPFVAPGPLPPPARCLTSGTIGGWLGLLVRLPRLSGVMVDWMADAKAQLRWRETCEPRVFETYVGPGKRPLRFSVDDSLRDVERPEGRS